MPAIRLPLLASALLVLLLQACATAPSVEEPAAEPTPQPQPVPELTLNLPKDESCICVREEPADYTFLEKGFSALVVGDHVEAVQYFQQYKRLESSTEANWEADISIAYDSMLRSSPFYDPQAAGVSYERLQQQQPRGVQLHEKTLIMRDALATFAAMQQEISELEGDNAILTENLAKREEALKRLRELALGQKGATP